MDALGSSALGASHVNGNYAPGQRPFPSYPQSSAFDFNNVLQPPYSSQTSLNSSNQSLPFSTPGRPSQSLPSSNSHTPAPPSAFVHRHQATNSGIEIVFAHLHALSHRVMSSHPGTMVIFSRIDDSPIHHLGTGGFNFHITGPYSSVTAARGIILRESSVRNRCIIRVARSDILDTGGSSFVAANHVHGNGGSATASSSVSSSPDSFSASQVTGSAIGNGGSGSQLRPHVIARLDEIAAQTGANISVLKAANSALSANFGVGYAGPYGDVAGAVNVPDGNLWNAGLECEKMCELIVTGVGDSVDIARVRLLVMLDEFVSFQIAFSSVFSSNILFVSRDSMLLPLTSTISFMESSVVASVVRFNKSWKKLVPIFTFPLYPFKTCLKMAVMLTHKA